MHRRERIASPVGEPCQRARMDSILWHASADDWPFKTRRRKGAIPSPNLTNSLVAASRTENWSLSRSLTNFSSCLASPRFARLAFEDAHRVQLAMNSGIGSARLASARRQELTV